LTRSSRTCARAPPQALLGLGRGARPRPPLVERADICPRAPRPSTRPEGPDCRPPAHWSGPRGVPVRPASSPRQATTTRRGADRTTERAGGRATAPSWTARGRVARREASRYTPAYSIGIPIAQDGFGQCLDRRSRRATPKYRAVLVSSSFRRGITI